MKRYSKKAAMFMCLTVTMFGFIFSGCGKSKTEDAPVIAQKIWYKDNDKDGFGDKNTTQSGDTQPDGYVDNAFDCKDNDAKTNPMLGNCDGFEIKAGIIPDTGQTISYTNIFGEDHDFLINPPSYTKLDANGNILPDNAATWAMIKDNVTGLIWEMKDNPDANPNPNDIHDVDNTYTWDEAGTTYINALNDNNFGGFTDKKWRLPTVRELSLLINSGMYKPALNTNYFPFDSKSYYLWTATQSLTNSMNAVFFSTLDGTNNDVAKTTKCGVWAVRGEEAVSTFVDMGSGIIQDTTTGLMWQQSTATNTDGKGYTYEDALKYCNSSKLGGFTDWRLPNRNELLTLIKFDQQKPSISELFSDTAKTAYWTSTTYFQPFDPLGGISDQGTHPFTAWIINFNPIKISFELKGNQYNVKAVRGGKNLNLRKWYKDADGDGYGDSAVFTEINGSLPQPTGYVANDTDCDDKVSTKNPAATEIPNDGIDQNCNGKYLITWYKDADFDHYGDPNNTILAETQPTGYIMVGGDFNDSNVSINPDMATFFVGFPNLIDFIGDGIDNECNGKQNVYWYVDNDNDGYGDKNGDTYGIGEDTPPNYVQHLVRNNWDCDDDHSNINPGRTGAEGCNNNIYQISIPDTGQTATYTAIGGEDGAYLINAPSYTKISSDGTPLPDSATDWSAVRDNVTGLYWEVKTDTNKSAIYNYSEAAAYINNLNVGKRANKDRWRLPTATELAMIANLGKSSGPAINTDYFKNMLADKYWTDTDTGVNPGVNLYHLIVISFRYGESYTALNTDSTIHVIAVCDGDTAKLKDNGDKTFTDKQTGLVWNSNVSFTKQQSFSDTINNLTPTVFPSKDDWRLPTADEVNSLLTIFSDNKTLITTFIPAFDPINNIGYNQQFWTCTLSSKSTSQAMVYSFVPHKAQNKDVDLYDNITLTNYNTSSSVCSISVKGTPRPRFIVNGDGTVLDSRTGLMWTQNDVANGTKMTFPDALAYCKNTLNGTGYAGYNDWRIPSRNELLSLLDASISSWDNYVKAFSNTGSQYWTSSTCADTVNNPDFAWMIDFTDNAWGITLGGYTTQNNAFRAVRGGTP